MLNPRFEKRGEIVLVLRHVTSVFLCLLASVFLLAFPLGGYEVIGDFKYSLFLLICGGYCVVIIVVRVQLAVVGIRPFGKIKECVAEIPIPMKCMFLYLGFVALSALFSDFSGVLIGEFRQDGLLTIAIYVFSCFFVSKYFQPHQFAVQWILPLFGVSAVLFCVLTLVQLMGANPFTLFPPGYNYYGSGVYFQERFLGTTGNAGIGGAFLGLAIGLFLMAFVKFEKHFFFAVPLFFTAWVIFEIDILAAVFSLLVGFVLMLPVAVTCGRELKRVFSATAILFLSFALSHIVVFGDGTTALNFSGSMPLVAVGLGIFLLAAGYFLRCTYAGSMFRIGAVAVVFFVFCSAFFYLWFFGSQHQGVVFEAAEVIQGRADDSFGTSRVYIWRNVIERLTLVSLPLGTGPDTLGFWDIPPFTRFSEVHGRTLISVIDSAHNEYLHILATTGVFSFLAYISALLLAAVKWYRSPKNAITAVSGAGILFYCLQAFFGISMPITAPFFWACFGVFMCQSSALLDK